MITPSCAGCLHICLLYLLHLRGHCIKDALAVIVSLCPFRGIDFATWLLLSQTWTQSRPEPFEGVCSKGCATEMVHFRITNTATGEDTYCLREPDSSKRDVEACWREETRRPNTTALHTCQIDTSGHKNVCVLVPSASRVKRGMTMAVVDWSKCRTGEIRGGTSTVSFVQPCFSSGVYFILVCSS